MIVEKIKIYTKIVHCDSWTFEKRAAGTAVFVCAIRGV